MATISDVTKGSIIKYNNEPAVIIEYRAVKPGKGPAFTRTKLKGIISGKLLEITFKTTQEVEEVTVEKKNLQFLYGDADSLNFMEPETFEQVTVARDLVGTAGNFLKEGQKVIGVYFEGTVCAVEVPIKVTLKVTAAPGAVKGDTAGGNVLKEVTLETDATIRVPIFIKEGEEVIINTETEEYVGRANG